jgi:hypothetical protein
VNEAIQPLPREAIEARRRALAMVGAMVQGKPVWSFITDDLKDYAKGENISDGVPVTFESYRQESLKAQSAAMIAYWAMQKVQLATGQPFAAQVKEYGDWLNLIPIAEDQ